MSDNSEQSGVVLENYRTFMDRCEVWFPHASCVKLGIVYKLVKFGHRFQTRRDEFNDDGTNVRYFEHVRRVALILMDRANIVDERCVVEALLHDAIEDTRLTVEEISFISGPEVAKGVLLMTKKPKQGFLDRLRGHGTWRELAVKVADRVDNLERLDNSTKEFRMKQFIETEKHYFGLCELLMNKAPEEFKPGCEVLSKMLRQAWCSIEQSGE